MTKDSQGQANADWPYRQAIAQRKYRHAGQKAKKRTRPGRAPHPSEGQQCPADLLPENGDMSEHNGDQQKARR
jgi:hypothetical protein